MINKTYNLFYRGGLPKRLKGWAWKAHRVRKGRKSSNLLSSAITKKALEKSFLFYVSITNKNSIFSIKNSVLI